MVPAPAGMSPAAQAAADTPGSAPRACGDGPKVMAELGYELVYSPHARG